MKAKFERYWHAVFECGVFIKGFNGVWETVSGIAVLLISKTTLSNWFNILAQRELVEDPSDRFINFIMPLLRSVSVSAKTFVAAYILFHGLLNLFLVIQLYRNKLWAYAVTIVALALSLVYQIYRINLHHSVLLSVITIFDGLFLVLTWHEYCYQKNKSRFVFPDKAGIFKQ